MKNRGYTLLELLVVIAIVGVVLTLVARRAFDADSAQSTQGFVANLTAFADRLTTTFRSPSMEFGSYTDTAGRVLAPEGFTTASAYRNALAPGGTLTVAAADWGGVTNGSLSIAVTGLSYQQCIDVALKSAPRFPRLSVGSTVVKSTSSTVLSASALSTPCGTSTTLTWTLL